MSEPVDRFWLEDNDALRQFAAQEVAYRLDRAVEQQVLNGSGVGENSRGMLQTPGILGAGVRRWADDDA